ncbi:MAG: MFS transporter [Betaproteobacteria bacterium]
MTGPLSRRDLWSYGVLGLPLAMAALPLYVHVPKFYGDTLGVDLAVVGIILLALRLLDCMIDPLLGAWSDGFGNRARSIGWALPPLALGMVALFAPPADTAGARAWWLAGTLAVVYAAYSLATINHHAWGAELSTDSHQRTRITATREGLALAGVVTAAILPGLFDDGAAGLRVLSWVFCVVLLACGGWTVASAPRNLPPPRPPAMPVRRALPAALSVPAFRRLLAVYMLNGIAAAIPATLVLFFIKDVVGDEAHQGWYLAVYFFAAATAMPLWVALSRRIGKAHAWLPGMGLAIASFVWALGIGNGDAAAFMVICAASGIALSADLALPPSLLADAIDSGPHDLGAGTYFGLWTLATKLNLALAAGIALPLVQWLGYRPGDSAGGGHSALTAVYAGVPCLLKLGAAVLCWLTLVRGTDGNGIAVRAN